MYCLMSARVGFWIIIQRDARDGACRVLGFLLKKCDAPFPVYRDRIVLLDLLEIADVVDAEHRRFFLRHEFAKTLQLFAEQIVARHHDDIIVDVLRFQDVMNIADRAEFVRIVR